MPKISEVVKIYSGMSKTVYLRKEFYNKAKNRERMQKYKPIASHRNIFLKIAKSFIPNPSNNKVHLLVGHYGTGKSHLLLMLANYFSNTLEMQELKTFFKNFDEVDRETSKAIQDIRGNGRYLVVIPKYSSHKDFSENILDAIDTSLKKENFEEDIDSIYEESLRTLDKWEHEETSGESTFPKFSTFKEKLSDMEVIDSLTTLRKRIQDYDRNALNTFMDIYDDMESQPFRYHADNLIDILNDTINTEAFKNRYRGIVILYDEFDYTLKHRRISIEVVQEFAELCKNSNDILFVGSLHKELSSFAHSYSEVDSRTVQQRFNSIEMRKEGLEEIAGAIVSVQKDNPIYQDNVKPNMQQLYNKINDIKRLDLFDWLRPAEINSKIIDAVYPLHPLAMACLMRLSTSVGSYHRTLFTFLGGEGSEDNKYSYESFINRNNIINKKGLLNLYTTDLLVEYFQKELNVDNPDTRKTITDIIKNYDSSLKEYKNYISQENTIIDNTHPMFTKILKLMLIFNIVGIENRKNNFMFGLNLQLTNKGELENCLEMLRNQKIIFYNNVSDVYEFIQGNELDWNITIENEKDKLLDSGELNIAEDFLGIHKKPGQNIYLDAKKYNGIKSTDRRLLRVFETVKNFAADKIDKNGNKINYFEYYENKLINITDWKLNYDGIIVYLIVENDEEIKEAREKCKQNNSEYIMVVIPENKIPIQEEYINLKSALSVKNSSEYQDASISDQARIDESFIGEINRGYIKAYNDKREKYLSGKRSIWYGINGKIIDSKPNNEQDVINKFFLKLYPKFNNTNDDEFNRIHKSLTGNKKLIFTDAVNDLLESGLNIKIDTSFGNDKGFIRYLKNIFFDNQLLKKNKASGTVIFCEIEKDTSKYKKKFPALDDMINEIKNNKEVNISNFVKNYIKSPYGLGQYSLIFFLAYIVKYFGDELFYKKDPSSPGEISIQSSKQLNKIANDPDKFAIFKRRKIDDIQKEFLVQIYQHYADESIPVDVVPNMKDTVAVIQNWFENLNKLNQSDDFYDNEKIKKYLRFLNESNTSDAYTTLFVKMQTVFEFAEDDKMDVNIKRSIIEGIKNYNKKIKNIDSKIKDRIFNRFLKIFNSDGETYEDLAKSIQEWYNNLDSDQKGLIHQSNESQPLINYFKDTQNIRNVIFNLIPSSQNYGLGKIKDWNTKSNIGLYFDKIIKGIKKIAQLKVLVKKPILAGKDYNSNKVIKYDENSLDLSVDVPDDIKEVRISYGNEDPTSKDAQIQKINTKTEIKPTQPNQDIKLVSVDHDGNFSKIIDLKLKEIHTGLVEADMFSYKIEIPKTEKEVKYIFKTLSRKLIKSEKITENKLVKYLKDIIEEYKT